MNKKNTLLLVVMMMVVAVSCGKKDDREAKNMPLNDQVRVQVAYDASEVAFKFTWKSQGKKYPEGKANVGRKYPSHYHDFMVHDGTRFNRHPSSDRVQEDRVSFTITDYDNGPQFFATLNCAASCHDGMESHNLVTDDIVDHWHWRGGRSSQMGYAEDAAISKNSRIRDASGTPPSAFTRAAGDRFREDQPALSGTAHPVLSNGFPRFVFNKGKRMPSGYTIPAYFVVNANDQVMTDPYADVPQATDPTINRSLIIVYQDRSFDNVDKVNALDVGYLLHVATGSVDHLPAHLRVTGSAAYTTWVNFSAAESGVGATATAAATSKLNEIVAEWEASGKRAMVTRSVSFIYNSDQHDIRSQHSYDTGRNEWTVTLYRKLSTGSANDADLADLRSGKRYSFAFAMHDLGAAAITHNISLPLTLSNGEQTDVKAVSVSDVSSVSWDQLPFFDSNYVKAEYVNEWKWTHGWLTGPSHAGAGMVTRSSCNSCHNGNLNYTSVQ
jgi:hypothetical protein